MFPYHKLTPEGTGDRLFEDCTRRDAVAGRLRTEFEQRGFRQVMTPTLEFYDVFGCAAPHLALEDMYKTTDLRGRLLTLRSDTTIPIARMVATSLGSSPLPLRLYYAQNVYRMEHQLRGRPHQIFQTGVELLGNHDLRSDLEVVELAVSGLAGFGEQSFRMELCHIGYFKALMDSLEAQASVKEQIRQSIEEKNYPSLRDLLEPFGDDPAAKALQYLPRLFGGEEVFERAYSLFPGNPKAAAALDELAGLCGYLRQLGVLDRVIFDLGLVNQAEYYTGIIFRGYFDGVGEPILSGGRYDNLLADFGRPMPAIGFAYNVDLIAAYIQKPPMKACDIMVYAPLEHLAVGLEYRKTLLDSGFRVEFSVFDDFDKAYACCKQKGIAQLHIVDEDIEVLDVTLKREETT